MDSAARHHPGFATSPAPGEPDAAPHARRIALLLHSLAGGGAQRRVATLANAFAADGRQVDVVTLDPAGPVAALLSPTVRVVALRVRRPLKGVLTRLHAPALAGYIRDHRPDVLMSGVTNTHALAVAGAGRAMARTPVLLRASRHPLRAIGWRDPLRRLAEIARRAAAARTYARADAIVAVSRGVARGLADLLGGASPPVTTVLNPVICAEVTAASDPLPGLDVPLIVGVGRFVRQKDFPTLLRAFARLRRDRPARLALLGAGPDRARLQALARRLGIADDLLLPGEVDDVPAWLCRAAMLVSASLWEGLPATLVEALAAGCPVVATDCPGGSREILEGDGAGDGDGDDEGARFGLLVPMRDPVAMADAMRAILDAPPDRERLRLGAAPYVADDQASRYLALFDRCVAGDEAKLQDSRADSALGWREDG